MISSVLQVFFRVYRAYRSSTLWDCGLLSMSLNLDSASYLIQCASIILSYIGDKSGTHTTEEFAVRIK